MFEPVVKRDLPGARGGRARAPSSRARRARRCAAAPARLRRGADRPAGRGGRRTRPTSGAAAPGAARAPDEQQLAQAAEPLERARRPLIWAGGGALQADAGEAVGAPRRAAGRAGDRSPTPRAGCCRPDHPCLVEATPHVPEVGALWDEADAVIAIGTDFDGMMTQGWKQPQPPHLIAINVDPADASKNYLPDVLVEADAAAGAAALAERLAERGGLDALAQRLARAEPGRRAPTWRETRRRGARVPRGDRARRCPTTPWWSATCASPATGWAASTAPRRRASWPTRSAGARSAARFPQGLGAALAGAGPGGERVRRRRLPVRLRRAGHGWPRSASRSPP